MAARLNFAASMTRDHVGGTQVRNVDVKGKPRVDIYTCPRCGVRCDPEAGIGCGHQVRSLSSRIHHNGGIIR